MNEVANHSRKLARVLVLVACVFGIFLVGSYLLQLPIEVVVLSSLLFPIAIILMGKAAELIVGLLERASTAPLSFMGTKNTLLLMSYYASFSVLLAFLIENSAILSLLGFKASEAHVAFTSLGLAFLPRVISYASGMERAKTVLVQILTPLTLTSVVVLFFEPASTLLRWQTLGLCVLGSTMTATIGDLTLYFVGFLGMIHPRITFETVSVLNLERLVKSQLETLQWDPICDILKESKSVKRSDISQKILKAMSLFISESRKRGASLARISYADSLVRALHFEPDLGEDLAPLLGTLKQDPDAGVRARIAFYYGLRLRNAPDKGLEDLLEFLNDQDARVLEEVGDALAYPLIGDISEEVVQLLVSHVINLSMNSAFLDQLMEDPVIRHSPGGSVRYMKTPIVRAVEIACARSPDTVISHIQRCSNSANPKRRALAALISSSSRLRDDTKIASIRKRLKSDRNVLVRMYARGIYHVRAAVEKGELYRLLQD